MSSLTVAKPAIRGLVWLDVLVLLKLRIAALIATTAVAAALAAGEQDPGRLLALAFAATACAAGAGSLNHWFDRELDAAMPRTRGRPLPAGRLSPCVALGMGLALVFVPVVVVGEIGPGAALYLLAGAATYVLVYTWWLKPRTPMSIVWGGAAGSFAALAGWQMGASTLAPAPLLLAGVLFLWTPTHFWSFAIARDRDYVSAGVPTLPALAGSERAARAAAASALGLALWSWLLGLFLPWPYLAFALPAGIWFLLLALRLARDPTPERAWSVFKLSGLYLLVVLAGLTAAGLT